jgi:hypothetical protein
VIREQLEHGLNPYIISRHTPGDKEVQQVRYTAMISRPVGRFASAEVGTVASTNSREESASFGRDKTCVPSDMIRVPVASDWKPWAQGLEKSSVDGRRVVARRTVDGRHCQRPWEGFKADSNNLQFVALKAEVFVVT